MTWLAKTGAPMGSDYRAGSLEATMHWQVIWPRAIARAWEDEAFHAALLADPRKAILEGFGYELSPDLDLTIADAPADATFDPALEGKPDGEATDPWGKLPNLALTISIPPAPPPALQAVAITAYQDTGRTYPFTCC